MTCGCGSAPVVAGEWSVPQPQPHARAQHFPAQTLRVRTYVCWSLVRAEFTPFTPLVRHDFIGAEFTLHATRRDGTAVPSIVSGPVIPRVSSQGPDSSPTRPNLTEEHDANNKPGTRSRHGRLGRVVEEGPSLGRYVNPVPYGPRETETVVFRVSFGFSFRTRSDNFFPPESLVTAKCERF